MFIVSMRSDWPGVQDHSLIRMAVGFALARIYAGGIWF